MSDFCCISLSQNALDYRMIVDLVPMIFFNVNYFSLRSMGSCLSVELKTDGNSALQCMCLKVVVVNNCNADLMDCFFVLFCFFFIICRMHSVVTRNYYVHTRSTENVPMSLSRKTSCKSSCYCFND